MENQPFEIQEPAHISHVVIKALKLYEDFTKGQKR
jgi:hypothetical protein